MVRIAVIPGDGIANEVVPEAVKVLETADKLFNIGLDYELFDFGAGHYLRTGQAVPDDFDAFIQALPAKFDTQRTLAKAQPATGIPPEGSSVQRFG